MLLAFNLRHVLNITPEQAYEGRALMLIIGVYVSLGFPFSVFGGVINGFQRYDLNNMVGVGSSVVVAIVNVAMLLTGRSLIELVLVTTSIRVAAYFIYRLNAYAVFRPLSLRASSFRWSRVRELASFSVYMSVIDWSSKLNYSIDAIIIGAFMSASAVTLWTVPQRLAEMLQRMTNQVNGVLFPVVVDSDTGQKSDRLRAIFIQGTRLSLVSVLPLGASLCLLARPLILAWVGPAFDESIAVTQILIVVITIRVGNSTATTVLKGAGCHRLLAFSNGGTALANVGLSLLWIERRPDRSGNGHADSGGVHVDRDFVAGGVPPRWPRAGRGVHPRSVADLVAGRGHGAGHHSSTRGAAGAAVRGGTRRRHRRALLFDDVSGIRCEEGRASHVSREGERAREEPPPGGRGGVAMVSLREISGSRFVGSRFVGSSGSSGYRASALAAVTGSEALR